MGAPTIHTGPAESPQAPSTVLAERGPVLRRALRGLPEPMLEALVTGLSKHGDDLVAGRLYSGRGGGCAVGVMLRELDPERYERGRLRFWLRDRWRRGVRSYAGPIHRTPRLWHLEWTFDAAATELRREGTARSRREAAVAVGAWVRDEAEAELRWRSLTRRGQVGENASGRSLSGPLALGVGGG